MKQSENRKIITGKAAGQWLQRAEDIIFPGRCPVCDDAVRPFGALICRACAAKIKYIREPFCAKCGKPLLQEEKEYCYDCTRKKHFYEKGRALFEYNSVSASIYRFKYGGRQEYAEFYGRCLAEKLGEQISRWKPDAFVPVPIHRDRMRKRGYNQAELLACVAGRELEIPVLPIVERCRKTIPQKKLDDAGRQNNLKKAFKICQNDVKLKTIVIIDDIYTTGNTIDAVALELLRAGCTSIYYVALAIGRGL